MALPAAIALGMVAAVGIPWLARAADMPGRDWIETTAIHLPIDGITLHFSWPIFCVVALILWGVLSASRQR